MAIALLGAIDTDHIRQIGIEMTCPGCAEQQQSMTNMHKQLPTIPNRARLASTHPHTSRDFWLAKTAWAST